MLISPIEKIQFQGFEFYIKRDDLLGEINGNKARKLAFTFLKIIIRANAL